MSQSKSNYTLVDLGLTKFQSEIYSALLKIGTTTILDLSKTSGINRITVHKTIDELIELGLVCSYVSGKRRKIQAEPPEKLKLILGSQKNELERKEGFLGDLINDMYKHVNSVKDHTDSEVKHYKGYKAVRELYDEILQSHEVHAIVNSMETIGNFPENIKKFKDAAHRGVFIKDLMQEDCQPDFKKLAEKYSNYKYKLLPKDFNSKGAVDFLLYQDKVAIVLADKVPSAIVIKNKVLFLFALEIHKVLWTASKFDNML